MADSLGMQHNAPSSAPNLSTTFDPRHFATRERQRASQACDGCRRTKERCIGAPCRRCVRLQRRCEFTKRPPMRTKASRARDASASQDPIEAPANILHSRVTSMERILKYYLPGLDLDTDALRRKAQSLTLKEADANNGNSASDSGPGEDFAIGDENYTINVVTDTVSHYSGEFSYWNFAMRLNRQVKDLMCSDDQNQVPHYWRVEQLHSTSTALSEAASSLPPFQIAEFLIRVFFKYAVSNYYYVDARWLSEKLNFAYDKPSGLTSQDAGTLAIILCVLAIGTQYVHLDASRQPGDKNHDPQDQELGAMFYQKAARLLPEVIHLGSFESVQACLLLGLYALPIDASGLGYIYLNLAIKLAMQNGMHRRSSDAVFRPITAQSRSKLWWTIYCTEKKLSIYHGRPISARLDDIDADLPSDESETQVAGTSTNIPNLLNSIKLTNYLGDFWEEILLLRKSPESQIPVILRRLLSRKEAFNGFWGSLSFSDDSHSRASVHLQLEGCLARMFVGRPFLLSRDASAMGTSPGSEANSAHRDASNRTGTDLGERSTRKLRPSSLARDCVHAAIEAIGLCESLRDSNIGLAKASYVEYSSCRASLLVLIAFCIQSQTIQYYGHLQKGLTVIREMSTMGDSAKCEVLLIENLERAANRLHALSLKKQSARDSHFQPKAGYDDFRQWGAMWKSVGSSNDPSALQSQQPPQASSSINHAQERRRQLHGSDHVDVDFERNDPHVGVDLANAGMESGHFTSSSRGQPMVTDSASFGFDGMFSGSSLFYPQSERQLLEDFLAIPEWEFSRFQGQ